MLQRIPHHPLTPNLMKPILLILCTAVMAQFAHAQCTCNNDLVYEAERVYRSDFDPQKAVKLYTEAFANTITDGSAYLEAIECAAMIGDTASAIHFLEKGLGVGLTTSSYKKLWGQLGKGIS